MPKFSLRLATIALVAFALQILGAFLIGTRISSRYSPSSGISSDELPSPLLGGVTTAAAVCAFLVAGFALRFLAYRRLERRGMANQWLWLGIAVAEAAYAYVNLRIVWSASEPAIDAGYGWLVFAELALIVTGVSLVVFVVAILLTRRRTLAPVPN